VFGINALQVARYRERRSVSAAESDPADAHTLADMVRTDSHELRAVAADSDAAETQFRRRRDLVIDGVSPYSLVIKRA